MDGWRDEALKEGQRVKSDQDDENEEETSRREALFNQ